jgi:hypothetical protein
MKEPVIPAKCPVPFVIVAVPENVFPAWFATDVAVTVLPSMNVSEKLTFNPPPELVPLTVTVVCPYGETVPEPRSVKFDVLPEPLPLNVNEICVSV